MSTRIHELAKKHNMEGRDMLALLKERGYVAADTKSVSSTVSKIYIEEIEKEFAAKAGSAPAPEQAAPAAPPAAAAEPSKARSPIGIFVKTAQDVAREREAVAVAKAGTPPPRPAAPVVKAPRLLLRGPWRPSAPPPFSPLRSRRPLRRSPRRPRQSRRPSPPSRRPPPSSRLKSPLRGPRRCLPAHPPSRGRSRRWPPPLRRRPWSRSRAG